VLLRLYKKTHHDQVTELHKSQYGNKGIGPLGTTYDGGYSRLSGSPETSLFNSIDNAFVAYVALKKTKLDGVYLSADQAYNGLGIYGGDDGLTADVEPETYVEAAKLVGQELTVEKVSKGRIGVKFLARVYSPGVWYGSTNSCCDISRQLGKIHVSPNMTKDVTPIEKLVEKTRGFLLSDSNTPIIGPFYNKVAELYDGDIKLNEKTKSMRAWFSSYDKEDQYDNDPEDWMDDYFKATLSRFDDVTFHNWLDDQKNLNDMLKPPLCAEIMMPLSPYSVVINGEPQPTIPAKPIPKVKGYKKAEKIKTKLDSEKEVKTEVESKWLGKTEKEVKVEITDSKHSDKPKHTYYVGTQRVTKEPPVKQTKSVGSKGLPFAKKTWQKKGK